MLLNSVTSSHFVSLGFLQQLGMSHSSSNAKLNLADSSGAPILGKVRLRFKLQHFTATATCFVTDLCDEFSVVQGNSFMSSHKAVLDYANNTASFRRNGRLFTVTPSSVFSDGVASASAELLDVKFRQSDSSSSLPKAKFKDRSNQHAAFSAILGDATPRHFSQLCSC